VLTPAFWLIQWVEGIGFSSLFTQPLTIFCQLIQESKGDLHAALFRFE